MFRIMGLTLFLITGCATSSGPGTTDTGTREISSHAVLYEGLEMDVALGFHHATRSIGDEWLVVAVELTANSRSSPRPRQSRGVPGELWRGPSGGRASPQIAAHNRPVRSRSNALRPVVSPGTLRRVCLRRGFRQHLPVVLWPAGLQGPRWGATRTLASRDRVRRESRGYTV